MKGMANVHFGSVSNGSNWGYLFFAELLNAMNHSIEQLNNATTNGIQEQVSKKLLSNMS